MSNTSDPLELDARFQTSHPLGDLGLKLGLHVTISDSVDLGLQPRDLLFVTSDRGCQFLSRGRRYIVGCHSSSSYHPCRTVAASTALAQSPGMLAYPVSGWSSMRQRPS